MISVHRLTPYFYISDSAFIAIDRVSGVISIAPINRDALKQEVFTFEIIAYKYNNETWDITGNAVLIVDDLNDNYPIVTASPQIIRIKEATYLTLPMDMLNINDIDLVYCRPIFIAQFTR